MVCLAAFGYISRHILVAYCLCCVFNLFNTNIGSDNTRQISNLLTGSKVRINSSAIRCQNATRRQISSPLTTPVPQILKKPDRGRVHGSIAQATNDDLIYSQKVAVIVCTVLLTILSCTIVSLIASIKYLVDRC